MRTEEEVTKAIKHLQDGMVGAILGGHFETQETKYLMVMTEILEWVAGQENKFSLLIKNLDEQDRLFEQAQKAQAN